MKHLFVPYDIARQLKEKGFNEMCLAKHEREDYGVETVELTLNSEPDLQNEELFEVDAPLYQQVVDWFRQSKVLLMICIHTTKP